MLEGRSQLHERRQVPGFDTPTMGWISTAATSSIATILLPARSIMGPLYQYALHLIDVPVQLAIQYQRNQQALHVLDGDVIEIPRDASQPNPRVRSNVAHDDLRPNRAEQIGDVFPNEFVVHDASLVLLEDLLELAYVIVVKRLDEVGHGHNLGIVAMRPGLVAVEGIDAAGVQHARHDEILQASQAAAISRLVVALERLEEGLGRIVEVALAHVHLWKQN